VVFPDSLSDGIGAWAALNCGGLGGLLLPEALSGLTETEMPAKAMEVRQLARVANCGNPIFVRNELNVLGEARKELSVCGKLTAGGSGIGICIGIGPGAAIFCAWFAGLTGCSALSNAAEYGNPLGP